MRYCEDFIRYLKCLLNYYKAKVIKHQTKKFNEKCVWGVGNGDSFSRLKNVANLIKRESICKSKCFCVPLLTAANFLSQVTGFSLLINFNY